MQRFYSCLVLVILCASRDLASGSFDVMTEEQCHQLMEESCNASRILEINACDNHCADCSCSKDCTESINCCFDEMYSNERAEADYLTCTPSVVGNKYREDRFGLYMITTCPTNTSEINQCGEETLTFWGSLSPVYSPQRKLIYKNERCAQCHHANDVVNLKTTLQCQIHTNDIKAKSLDEVMTRVKMNFDDQQFCFVQFELPEETLHIPRRVLQCFPNLINTCNGSDSLASPELVNICEKGPLMPVMSADYPRVIWYRNLFCQSCHRDQNLCRHPKHAFMSYGKPNTPFGSAGSFTVMLAGKTSTETSMPVGPRRAYLRRVCISWGIDNVCRPLFCPSTRLVQPDGKCGPPILDLIISKFRIHLTFTLTPNIHEHIFLDMIKTLDGSGKQFPVNFNSPWARSWTAIPGVMYVSKNGKVDNFMYMLLRGNNRKSYAEVVSDTERLLNMQWRTRVDNKDFVVTQTFSRFFDFVPITDSSGAGSTDIIPVDIASVSRQERAILSQYSEEIKAFSTYVLSEINVQIFNYFMLSKFAFCEQIELRSDELYVFKNSYILFVNSSGQILFSNEFHTFVDPNTKETIYRICLEKSMISGSTKSADTDYSYVVLLYLAFSSVFLATFPAQ